MKKIKRNLLAVLIAAAFALTCALPSSLALIKEAGTLTVPEGYNEHDYQKCLAFLETEDEEGVKNGEKLSETYDPLEPSTWGVHDEIELDCIYTDVPTASWCEVDGELRLEQFRTSQWSGNGLVGELDFSGCTSLLGLVCSGNEIGSVNVSGCDALIELVCHNSGLASLDVSGNGLLQRLYCSGNPLGSIDVSANLALAQLDVNGLGLTELDLSANTNLCLLYCSNNELTALDITANTRVWDFVCEHNPLKEIRMADRTIKAEGSGTVGFYTEAIHPLPDIWQYVVAYPNDGAEFLGWYEQGGLLIGTDLEFETINVVTEYHARFTGWDELIWLNGDADGDGSVTVSDAILVLRAAMGICEFTGEQIAHADMDENGAITVTDAILVLRAAMGV